MRKWRTLLCLALLIALVPAALRLRRALPLDPQPLIEEKYGGWAGVLRLWVCEGWLPGGGAAAWLNRCVQGFERAHEGVYIQPEYVDETAVADLGANGMLPPDMLLFAPGMLRSPELLSPLTFKDTLREPLGRSGEYDGACLAVPVAMGGYLWAYDADAMASPPGSWRKAGLSVSAPPDEPRRQWSAALLALCSVRYAVTDDDAPAAPDPLELDLGLTDISPTDAPTGTPAPTDAPLYDCRLSSDFEFAPDALTRFMNGEISAVPVTQREIRRLEALSEQGRGPAWRLARTGDGMFTDQLLLFGMPRPASPDGASADAKAALCRAFLDHLLSDACQGELCRAGLFSVTSTASGYGPADALLTMDSALRASTLVFPNAFDESWRSDAADIVRDFIDENDSASTVWRRLGKRLAEKANIN